MPATHRPARVAVGVFPDLDVAFMRVGKRFDLKNHQAVPPSRGLAPLYAVLIAAGPAPRGRLYIPFDGALFTGALIGLEGHILLERADILRIREVANI